MEGVAKIPTSTTVVRLAGIWSTARVSLMVDSSSRLDSGRTLFRPLF
jgi:hypothetical protein